MKCLSLWQPWASLWASGLKIHETRHWATGYRGPLAIHAARRTDGTGFRNIVRFLQEIEVDTIPMLELFAAAVPPVGSIIAVGELVDCIKITGDVSRSRLATAPVDYACGNWEPGRFAWKLSNVRITAPLPFTGRQGLFSLPDETAAALQEANKR
jgi:activating signal cointegrator 1